MSKSVFMGLLGISRWAYSDKCLTLLRHHKTSKWFFYAPAAEVGETTRGEETTSDGANSGGLPPKKYARREKDRTEPGGGGSCAVWDLVPATKVVIVSLSARWEDVVKPSYVNFEIASPSFGLR